MVRDHVGGVGLPLMLHRHQAQANVVSSERTRFILTTNTIAQLPGMVNHLPGTGNLRLLNMTVKHFLLMTVKHFLIDTGSEVYIIKPNCKNF